MFIGRNRDDLRVGHTHLRLERRKVEVLLVLFRAVVAARKREDQRIVALKLAERTNDVRVVGQLVVGKRAAGCDVGAHCWLPFQVAMDGVRGSDAQRMTTTGSFDLCRTPSATLPRSALA